MWFLIIRSSSKRPAIYKIKPGKNIMGRKPDQDIVIADEAASREHAEIFFHGGQLVIYDLKSTNGTFVNQERLSKPRVLRTGDQIRIGQQIVTVSYRDDESTGELVAGFAKTRPLTRDLMLQAVDQHAVLLYEVSSRLNTILDLKTAMQEVSNLIRNSMCADKCEIIMLQAFDQLNELGFPSSIARQAIDQRSVVIIPDLEAQNEPTKSQSALLLRIRSILCVPVLIEGSVAALIYAYKTDPASRPFDENDVQLAVAISHQAALTIQRSNLMERSLVLEQSANFDSLTGLLARNHFLNLAEREFQRAQRLKHNLVFMMLDFDEFKQINDTYGHMVGDQVMKAVAELCTKQVRNIDLVGRFGGDEFIFLLVETAAKDATHVANRICKNIAEMTIKTDRGLLKMTVSIGVAPLYDGCPTLIDLLNRADKALYAAKNAGKNRGYLLEEDQ
jgi:diguanylate cyclase (GGDEF)-like protein